MGAGRHAGDYVVKKVLNPFLVIVIVSVMVPIGFEMVFDSPAPHVPALGSVPVASVVASAAPVVTSASPLPLSEAPGRSTRPASGAAKLIVVGTALFGLAAAVRRAM
jgi:hypothetical protein